MEPLAVDADLPPSARHVAHVLQERGPCTHSELIELTDSPPRTVTYALEQLREADAVESRPCPIDTRSIVYELA